MVVSDQYKFAEIISSRYMRKLVLATTLLLLLSSCGKKKETCYSNFTYSKGNIKMSYLLNFNSSDTVYYDDRYFYGEKKGLNYFLLERSEKEMLDSLICNFKFPKDSILVNNRINDGTTICFSIDDKRLALHGNEGSKEFWKFQKLMDIILNYKQLKPINRKVKFADFRPMFAHTTSRISSGGLK